MINILKRFQLLDMLIQEGRTGTPNELAEKLGVSRRTVLLDLRLMKKMGAPIGFNRLTKSYYYNTDGKFVCTFSFKVKKVGPVTPDNDGMKLTFGSLEHFLDNIGNTIMSNKN